MDVRVILPFLLLCAILQANGTLVKIRIQPDNGISERFKRQTGGSNAFACQDKVSVDRSAVINDLPGDLGMLNRSVTFWRSDFATDGLTRLLQRAVGGIDGVTVGDVFRALRNGNCFPFFYGGAVRDQFLGSPVNDVDTEVDCDIAIALEICIASWGSENCFGSSFLMIGNPISIDIAPTNVTFYAAPEALEYTVNSLAFDTSGTEIIIDLSGTGVRDVCSKWIKIPLDDMERWETWMSGSRGESKLYRFWKLRQKGFTAINNATKVYIVNATTMAIETSPVPFYKFYCKSVYETAYSSSLMECGAIPKADCASRMATATRYNQYLAEDLGEVWNSLTIPVAPCCKYIA